MFIVGGSIELVSFETKSVVYALNVIGRLHSNAPTDTS